jgi:hypothetical protein
MKRASAWSAVNAETLMSAASALIPGSTANSEASASSGKDRETGGKKKYQWGDKGMGRSGDRIMKDGEIGRWGDGEIGNERWGDQGIRR